MKRLELSNGILVTVETRKTELASIHFGIYAGSGDDGEKSGVAHYLEHLLFRGSKTMSKDEFLNSISLLGGMYNGGTSRDFTYYTVTAPGMNITEGIRLFSDVILNPALPEEFMEKERKIILEERKTILDNPIAKFTEVINEFVFEGDFGRPIIGYENDIESITIEDIKEFYNREYVSGNMNISVAASEEYIEDIMDMLESTFGTMPVIEGKGKKFIRPKNQGDGLDKVKTVEADSLQQSYVAITSQGIVREAGYTLREEVAAAMVSMIMGAGLTSRLYRKIREEMELAYNVGCQLDNAPSYSNQITHAIVEKGKEQETITAIDKLLDALVSGEDLITETEFISSKNTMLSRLASMAESTETMSFMNCTANVGEDSDITLAETIEVLKDITIDEVQAITSSMFGMEESAYVIYK